MIHARWSATADGRRARVAVVSSVHRWNDTRIYIKQAASLVQAGYDVVLTAVGAQRSEFESLGMRVHTLPRRRRALRWINWLSILRLIIVERAAIVHAHDPELFPLVLLLRLVGRKAICDVHEDVSQQVLHKEWVPAFLRGGLSKIITIGQRWLPSLADAVILAEDSYQRSFPAGANVSVIRNFPLLPPGFKQDYRCTVLRMIYVGDVRRLRYWRVRSDYRPTRQARCAGGASSRW